MSNLSAEVNPTTDIDSGPTPGHHDFWVASPRAAGQLTALVLRSESLRWSWGVP